MYLDPPYVRQARRSGAIYNHEMDLEGQVQLLEAITHSKAKIVISGYDTDLYNGYLQGWHKDTTFSQTTSTELAEEVVWQNYAPPAEQLSLL